MEGMIERHFLGWDRPLLDSACEWIEAEFSDPDATNDVGEPMVMIDDVLVVVPTRRAVFDLYKRFEDWNRRERLIDRARIIVVGDLPEHLYDHDSGDNATDSTQFVSDVERPRLAGELEQQLAWVAALQSADDLSPLVPRTPQPDATDAWLDLADTVSRLHVDLSAAGYTFADVARRVDRDDEQRRWECLDGVMHRYHGQLDALERLDPQRARRRAIDENRCGSGRAILLVGTNDLPQITRDMLSVCRAPVHALVAAPTSASDRFEPDGVVDRTGWADAEIEIGDDVLISAGDVNDQAAAAGRFVERAVGGGLKPSAVTVGVTDEGQVGYVEFELFSRDIDTHRLLGRTLTETAPGKWFTGLGDFVSSSTWHSAAAFLRHPDVMTWMGIIGGRAADRFLTTLDGLRANHFPRRLTDPLPQKTDPKFVELAETIRAAHGRIADSFTRLQNQSDATLGDFCDVMIMWLDAFYPEPMRCAERTTAAIERMRDMFAEHRGTRTPNDFDGFDGSIDALFRWFIDRMGSIRIVDGERSLRDDDANNRDANKDDANKDDANKDDANDRDADRDAVPVAGWLDLALDPNPAMVVVGLNHPFVPQAVTADPFLPGGLRSELKVGDNERRFARDAHALRMIVGCRGKVQIVVGQTAADQSPTPPSRLLAAAPPDVVARRMRLLLSNHRPTRNDSTTDNPADNPASDAAASPRWRRGNKRITIPQIPISVMTTGGDHPAAPRTIDRLTVTGFKNYLNCPYRFYLRHVLGIKPLDDSATEMAANQFGDLIHETMDRFGQSDAKTLTHPADIQRALTGFLDSVVDDWYGGRSVAAVALQIEQARRRLGAVASAQARRIADGWQIFASEQKIDESKAFIELDGRRMGLHGRLDRIDHHPDSGRYAVLDYKTHGHKPMAKHIQGKGDSAQWIDLQLPLYRRLLGFLDLNVAPENVQLGYFNIGNTAGETGVNLAEFSEAQFAEADRLIDDIIRRIWAEDFEPAEPPEFDDYDMILQTGIRDIDSVDDGVTEVPANVVTRGIES